MWFSTLVLVGGWVGMTTATLRPSLLFSDNMVLVSSPTVSATVFGEADPGEVVTLTDTRPHSTPLTATADASGRWIITLAPHVRDKGEPTFTLKLSGSGIGPPAVALNVAYGDVILCSGQSNMAITLSAAYNATEIIAAANRPEIRLFTVAKQGAPSPLPDLLNTTSDAGNPTWRPSTSSLAVQFSAVCYLTALELQRLHHPDDADAVYGLIDSAVGSTDVQSWMSTESRATALHTCWSPKNATSLPPSHSHSPTGQTASGELWNAMIHPLVPFGLSAMLWDQGENNAQYCSEGEYNCLFTSMIDHWRESFGQPNLPVAWVQIGGYAIDEYDQGGAALNSVIRFGQGDSLPNTTDQVFNNRSTSTAGSATDPRRFPLVVSAMAPTFDLGSPQNATACSLHPATALCWWIHCRNKTEVGRRLALQLAHVWTSPGGSAATGEWSGPTVTSTTVKTDPTTHMPYAEIAFAHAGGLALLPAQGCFHCCNQTAAPPKGQVGSGEWLFEVANRRGEWLPAIGGQVDAATGTMRVTPLTNVTCPMPKGSSSCWLAAVRYAVVDVPQCAIYNTAELPASQFELPVPWSS